MRDSPKSHLLTENEGPAKLQGRTAVHLDAPAAERQRHVRALRASEIRYRRLFESAPYGILVLEAETGVIVDVNPCLSRLLGVPARDLLDQPLWNIPAFMNAASTKNHFRDLLNQAHVRYDALPLETKDGQIKRVELVSTLFQADNKQFVQCVVHDVTDRVKREVEDSERALLADTSATIAAQRNTERATHDEETGLANRWYLEETLPRELHRAARARTSLTVSVLALDGTLEPAMLREVGRVIREHLRKSDMACRCVAAAEFVLVLPDSSPGATLQRLGQIQTALKGLELHHGDRLLSGLTVSAGVAIAGPHGTTTRELLAAAQNALAAAKKAGGDRVMLHQIEGEGAQ